MITIAPPTRGYSDELLETAIKRAGVVGKARNKNVTVLMEEGEYRFKDTVVCSKNVSLISSGMGRRSVRMVWPTTRDDMVLLEVRYSNGSVIDGLNIKGFGSGERVVGLHSVSNSSCVFSNLDIEISTGYDSLGLKHSRHNRYGESCVYEKMDIRSSGACVELDGGDNVTFRDFDFRAGSLVKDSVSAIFRVNQKRNPHHINIGPGSGQRGDHLYYCNSTSDSVAGGFLCMNSVRWEQPSRYDTTAIVHTPKRRDGKPGHVTERFNLINCRHSTVEKSMEIANTLKVEKIGCLFLESQLNKK